MEKLDLTQILKDCPKGTKLYSPIYGDVFFNEVKQHTTYPIRLQTPDGGEFGVMSDGRLCADFDGECTLFPSRDNRDWSTFKVEQPKQKFEPFQPFQKVLVRVNPGTTWEPRFYSHYDTELKRYSCINSVYKFYDCIPYEGNESLLGTIDDPKNGGIKGDFGTNGGEVVLPYNELQDLMKGE